MNRQLLPIFMATASLANAATVAWTANGTVSSATGVYSADGIVADTPVGIEMKYDDQAGHTITKELPFFSVEEIDYWNSIDLSISITIGDQTWKGNVHTAPDDNGFRTLFLKLDGKEGASESITATIQDDDGGSFEFFPLEVEAENSLIQLLFSSTDNNFLSNSVAENSLDENLITSATGFLQSGSSNKITFDLDPASIAIENEVLPPNSGYRPTPDQ
ncbi:hypothetical protein N9A86_01470 [Akkermansiaceae bacterium]|nr:hypothetical protein [Akkermansiaceae bacterium]